MISPSVFISYSNKDSEFIGQVANLLRSVSINCWVDIWGIQTGENLTTSIRDAITENDFFLCYLTENSINSKWVALEIKEVAAIKQPDAILFFIDQESTRSNLEKSVLSEIFPAINDKRIPQLDSSNLYPPLMEFISKIWSKVNDLRYPNISVSSVLAGANAMGLNKIKYGAITPEDDRRMRELMNNSKSILFLGYNGSSFVRQFSEEIKCFFLRPNTRMKVLIATPESEFYDENTYLVSKTFYKDKRDWIEMDNTKIRLTSYLNDGNGNSDESRLLIRHFNSQLRNSIIIFDNTVCLLTISVPPVESINSSTLEVIETFSSNAFIKRCIKHFESIWEVSKEINKVENNALNDHAAQA